MNTLPSYYIISYCAALFLALVLTPLTIVLARRFGIVDVPNARKVHSTPTPRIGGVAIALATFFVALPAAMLLSGTAGFINRVTAVHMVALFASAGILLLVGLVDDIVAVPSKYKLIVLLIGATIFCTFGGRIESINGGGRTLLELGWMSWPVTILWIVGVPVSLNFIDGLDGLAAGIASVATGALAIAAFTGGEYVMTLLLLALLGSLTGFLVFNFNPAKIFMGDCGSLFIGFMIACCGVLTSTRAGTVAGVAVPAIALSIPFFDTFLTFIRRSVLDRSSLFTAERGHIHHRLLDLGLCQRHAVLLLYGASLLIGALDLIVLFGEKRAVLCAIVGLVVVLFGLFRIAGSMRVRDTIAAVRRNRAMGRESRKNRTAFEELQIRFRRVRTFDAWWEQVCAAADMLGFTQLTIPLEKRDRTSSTMHWTRGDEKFAGCDTMTVSVPIPQRRATSVVKAKVDVATDTSLEMAGERVALFARLMEEYSLRRLDGKKEPISPAGLITAQRLRSPAVRTVRWSSGEGKPQVYRTDGKPAGLRPLANLKVGIVHDFLYTYAGAERVLEQIIKVFPQADLFSLFDFLPADQRGFLQGKQVKTSFLQHMPLAKRKHRMYLPLMPLAIEQLDMSQYDVVVSSSYVAAKGVLTRPTQLHLCYCHSPVRFAWDLQHQYLGQVGLTGGIKSFLARVILHYTRIWDFRSANGVDVFLCNSKFVSRRIEKVYRRDSVPIYPPVDIDQFTMNADKDDYYMTASRLVPYKRIDLIIEAFNRMPDRRLIVVGEGPDFKKLQAMAGPNVRMVGYQPFNRLKLFMQHARAFIFAAEEDFGIVPVEAQACGTPVIAFGQGGVTESVISGKTGLFFTEQTPESLMDAVEEFEEIGTWDAQVIRENAERFSPEKFREKLHAVAQSEWDLFTSSGSARDAHRYDPAGQELPDFDGKPIEVKVG